MQQPQKVTLQNRQKDAPLRNLMSRPRKPLEFPPPRRIISVMKHHTTAVTHPAHDRLLTLKLQGAEHLAKVLESDAPEPTKLKAAMALARLAIPAPPAASPVAGSPTVREGSSPDAPVPSSSTAAPASRCPDHGAESSRTPSRSEPIAAPAPAAPQAQPHSPASVPAARTAAPPGRSATPHTPRPEIFNAPAKPLATVCFERLGMKVS